MLRRSTAVAFAVTYVAAVAVVTPRLAHAGACLSAQEDEVDLKILEAFAKPKAKPSDISAGPWMCVELAIGADSLVDGATGNFVKALADTFRARVIAACTKVVDRDGESSSPCVIALAAAGLAKVGAHDLFPLVDKLPEDPIDVGGGSRWTKTQLFGRMNDPRAVPVVIEMWKRAIPRADARQKKHHEMASWSAWRQTAAGVLAKVGTADDIAFLDEQAKATKDNHVAQACRDAAAAIAKRLKTP